jgi:hypothetical protein
LPVGFGGVHDGSASGAFISTSSSLQGIARHKHKIKIGLRGTYGSGAIFKFQDTGPRAGRLKGCVIHWSRGNAVLQCQQVSFRLKFRARAGQRHMCAPRRDNVR